MLWLRCGAWRGGDAARSSPVVGRLDRIGWNCNLRSDDNRGRSASRFVPTRYSHAHRRRGLDRLHLAFQCSGSKPDTGLGAGRVLAVSMLEFQGAVAAGSATWGAVAAWAGLGKALVWAGVGTILSAVLGFFLRLPDESIDFTPWNHWRLPLVIGADADGGPVLVNVEYHCES